MSMMPDKFEGSNNPVEAVISVHVGRVRDVSTEDYKIDVIQDKKFHANITGIPLPDLYDGFSRVHLWRDWGLAQ